VIAWTSAAAAAASGNAAGTAAAAAVAPAAACCAVPGVVSIKESLICNEFIEDAYPEPPVSAGVLFTYNSGVITAEAAAFMHFTQDHRGELEQQ
jgi:hypothetical protein